MKHRIKHLLLAIAIMLVSYSLLAQENSWINYDQQYFKIQVVKDGVYRVYLHPPSPNASTEVLLSPPLIV